MRKFCLAPLPVLPSATSTRVEISQPVIHRDDNGRVTITCSSPGAVICYSLDGSLPDPRTGSAIYLGPFQYPYKGTIRARAFEKSELAIATFDAQDGAVTPPNTVIPVTQDRNWESYDWVKRHTMLTALVRERKPELVFIGDSITHNMGGNPNEPTDEVWHKYYERRNAVNLGFGWDRTENVIWRLQHGELDGAEPKVAVVMIGTNNRDINTPAEIALGVRAICSELHKRSPKTKILLLAVFPRGEKPDDDRKKTEELNSLLAGFHGQDGVTFLDIGPKFLNADGTISQDVMHDFLHLISKGYKIWAEAMEPTLRSLLGEESPRR